MANIALILQGIQAAIALAPRVAEIAKAGKDMIDALFTAKVITKEQQDALHRFVDNQSELAALGIVPPSWQVEPDPE